MRFLIIFLFSSLMGGAAIAQDAEIRSTIGGQIEAFKADDFVGAFAFASPTIRDLFRTPDNFGAMVRSGYPMVWRPADVRYLELREEAGRLVQKVLITDAEGQSHVLEYQMIQQETGWKINGVRVLRQPGANA